MRTLLWFSFMVVAKATCDTLSGTGDVTQDSTTPPEYSRVNQDVYKGASTPVRQAGNWNSHITPPPIPKLPPPPTRSAPRTVSAAPIGLKPEEYSKPRAIKSPQPTSRSVTRKQGDDDDRLVYRPRTYSDDSSVLDTDDYDPCRNEYNDPESESVEYQQKEYPIAPIPSTYAPQLADYPQQPVVYAQQAPVYAQQPQVLARRPPLFTPQQPVYRAYVRAVRRGYRPPVYRRPTYAGILNSAAPFYRSADYARPVAYTIPIPAARRLVYGPAPVRYIQRPSVAYDGVGGVDYDNVVNLDYDEVKK